MTVFQGPAGSHWQLGATPSTIGNGAFKSFFSRLTNFVLLGEAHLATHRRSPKRYEQNVTLFVKNGSEVA